MEVFDFDYGWKRIRARLGKTGSVYIDLPSRSGYNGGEFRETIVLEDRRWRFTSLQYDCIDYFFHMWMDDQGNMSYANDMTRGIEYMREPYNPNYPNAGTLDDTAKLLYTVSHTIREYQKRNLPVEEVFELRKLYLNVALKTLGYDTIDAVAESLDDSRGYLGLNKVVDCLKEATAWFAPLPPKTSSVLNISFVFSFVPSSGNSSTVCFMSMLILPIKITFFDILITPSSLLI